MASKEGRAKIISIDGAWDEVTSDKFPTCYKANGQADLEGVVISCQFSVYSRKIAELLQIGETYVCKHWTYQELTTVQIKAKENPSLSSGSKGEYTNYSSGGGSGRKGGTSREILVAVCYKGAIELASHLVIPMEDIEKTISEHLAFMSTLSKIANEEDKDARPHAALLIALKDQGVTQDAIEREVGRSVDDWDNADVKAVTSVLADLKAGTIRADAIGDNTDDDDDMPPF